jgi:hypothetical protein
MQHWRDILAENIDTYLRELRSALEGADPALAQDALFDAEEHLSAELASIVERRSGQPAEIEAEFAAVVERYGSPEEVAAAYLANDGIVTSAGKPTTPLPTEESVASANGGPASVAPAPGAGLWRRFFGVAADAATYRALLYLLFSLVTGTFFFTVVVTGLSLSAGLLVLIIGIPFALGFLAVVRALALAEGKLVEKLLGTRMPRRSRFEPRGTGLWGRIRFWARDRRTWTAMLYMILQLPLGTAYFCLSVTGLAVGVWMVAAPFVQLATGDSYIYINGVQYLFPGWSLPLTVIAGAFVIVVMLHLIRLIGRAHGAYAKAMLVRVD